MSRMLRSRRCRPRERAAAGRTSTMTNAIPDALRRHARDHPSAVVVHTGSRSLTAEELWQRVRALATHLREGAAHACAACVSDSVIDFVTVFVAARAAGIPALVTAPDACAVARAVRSAGRSVVLTGTRRSAAGLARTLPASTVLSVDDAAAGPIPSPQGSPVELPASAGAVIYTSGTTRDPLGVIVTDRSFILNAHDLSRALPLSDVMSVAACVPFHTSYGLSVGVLLPLLVGKTIRPLSFGHARRLVSQLGREAGVMLLANPGVYRHHVKILIKPTSWCIMP